MSATSVEFGEGAGADLHLSAQRLDAAIAALMLPSGLSITVAIPLDQLRQAHFPAAHIISRFTDAVANARGLIQHDIGGKL
ncbi:hypothetical protein [Nostoc phage Nsp-JY18]